MQKLGITGHKGRLTALHWLGDSGSGVMGSMVLTFRRFTDWPVVKAANLLLLIVMWGAQAAYGQVKEETPQQTNNKIEQLALLARAHPVDIPVGPGDLLHIEVFDVPELTREVRVTVTGDIGFPLIAGKIQVAGLTAWQLEDKLAQLLLENGLVSHPQVSVFVKEQNSQPVTVIGAVKKPMVYQVARPTTLLELLAEAGGIEDAAGSVILITRQRLSEERKIEPASTRDGSEVNTETITIRLQDLLETANSSFNIPIYGGDVVNVPVAGIVYVVGSGVSQPGGYVMQSHGEQITVLKAVALAHGLTGFAKKDDAVIFRVNPATGERNAIPVHIKQLENNKTEDVAMKSNDILYVPQSGTKKALAVGAQAAVSLGTGVAIYRAGSR